MTTTDARSTINTQGRLHTLVVYFTKADGELRRMVCRYTGRPSRKSYLMLVWDLEKGDWRNVNLGTVREIKVLGREDRKPVRRERFETIKQEVHSLLF